MTELASLHAEYQDAQQKSTVRGQKKAQMEATAGFQFRDASMKSLVEQKKLTDITALEDATVREKQGQQQKRLVLLTVVQLQS